MEGPLSSSSAASSSGLRGLDDQEESVRIAVKALGDMRNGGGVPRSDSNFTTTTHSSYAMPAPSPSHSQSQSQSPTDPSPATSSSAVPTLSPISPPQFVSRMSHLPLVGSALRVYEQGKASSRVVKYGAEMVESSVKTISRPVIERLPVNVNQLDEFACRQLDRLDRYRRPSTSDVQSSSSPTSPSANDRDRARPKLKTKTLDGSAVADDDHDDHFGYDGDVNMKREDEEAGPPSSLRDFNSSRRREGGERGVPSWLEATSPFVAPPPPPPPPPDSRSSTPMQNGDVSDRELAHGRNGSGSAQSQREQPQQQEQGQGQGQEQQVAQRSRWQAVLLEAGGLSAALSEESMRRLKYCLQWLQYATAHIDAQILILRDFTASLQPIPPPPTPTPTSSPPSTTAAQNAPQSETHRRPRPPISEDHLRKLTSIRRDIVHTIRQVVDVISKYAGGALPEPARGRVRGFILKLPHRWAASASGVSGRGVFGGLGGAGGLGAGALGLGGTESGSGSGSGGGGMNAVTTGTERETVAAAASGGGGAALRRPGGQRRAAERRERGVDASSSSSSVVGIGGLRSGQSSRAPSPSGSEPLVVGVSHSAALVASQRILVLAMESLDMMRNVTGVVKDSLDRAEGWVNRLRTVGIQRGAQEGEDDSSIPFEDRLPGGADGPRGLDDVAFGDRLDYRRTERERQHRRTDSSQSVMSMMTSASGYMDDVDDDDTESNSKLAGPSGGRRYASSSTSFSPSASASVSVSASASSTTLSSTVWGGSSVSNQTQTSNNSVPTTPGGPGYPVSAAFAGALHRSVGSSSSSSSSNGGGGGGGGIGASPVISSIQIPIGAMSIKGKGSRVEEDVLGDAIWRKGREVRGRNDVRVVGREEEEEEEGVQKMEVDV